MKIYQITQIGSRYSHDPYLERTLDNKILYILDRATGATREKLMGLTGENEESVQSALSRLQSKKFVVGVQ